MKLTLIHISHLRNSLYKIHSFVSGLNPMDLYVTTGEEVTQEDIFNLDRYVVSALAALDVILAKMGDAGAQEREDLFPEQIEIL